MDSNVNYGKQKAFKSSLDKYQPGQSSNIQNQKQYLRANVYSLTISEC